VATTVGNFYSGSYCANWDNQFHATVTVNRTYPKAGPLNVWWITISGPVLAHPDGFWIS
jgi:hypothetical protein